MIETMQRRGGLLGFQNFSFVKNALLTWRMRTVSDLEFVFATFTFPKMCLVCHPKFCISIYGFKPSNTTTDDYKQF